MAEKIGRFREERNIRTADFFEAYPVENGKNKVYFCLGGGFNVYQGL